MEVKQPSKEAIHALNQERFKKSPQEKEDSKRLKSEWKKSNSKK